jgi:hypothetical protein
MSGLHTCQLESLRRSLVAGDDVSVLDIVVGGEAERWASEGVVICRAERVEHCAQREYYCWCRPITRCKAVLCMRATDDVMDEEG